MVKIPQTLLNVISDINAEEILTHDSKESLQSWLCAWHEAVKRELCDFANNHALYEQGGTDMLNEVQDKLTSDYYGKLDEESLTVAQVINYLEKQKEGRTV